MNIGVTAGRSSIGKHCYIAPNAVIDVVGEFVLGDCSYIGRGVRIICSEFHAGDYLYMKEHVQVGGGGGQAWPDSSCTLGHSVFVGEYSILNTDRPLSIGDETGLGANVGVWTHGVYPPADLGFPCAFKRTTIGSRCWIPGQTQILPGVTIGDNVVVGMMSLVNRDLPDGCLAGGVPAKVLKERVFPAPVDPDLFAERICADYLVRYRWIDAGKERLESLERSTGPGTIKLTTSQGHCTFNIPRRKARSSLGMLTPLAEDLRNFLRRHGVRIRTGELYRSLPPRRNR